MNRRDLLKLAPVAALAPVATKIGNTEAEAYELKPGKKYVAVCREGIPDQQSIEAFGAEMRRLGVDGTLIFGDVEFYELT